MRRWILIGSLVLVAGCAAWPRYVWRKPDVSEAQHRADEQTCDKDAAAIRAQPPPYGGKGLGVLTAEHERRAQDALDACMRSKGYTLERL